MLIALSAIFIHEYWISWNKFLSNWGFPWVLLFRKEKQRIFQLHQLIGRDQIKRWQNISGFFLQIFAISRFDLAKLQNSAWFVKKFWTYNCGRNTYWALQICSGTFHIFCRRELAWSWIQGSGPPNCRAINPPWTHTRAQVVYGFSQIYCHSWRSIAGNNL